MPSVDSQSEFWDQWNMTNRTGGFDTLMERQRDMAVTWLRKCKRPAAILEIGCGTGWLANQLSEYGTVYGVDLSRRSIAAASAQYPHLKFEAGDFQSMPIEGRFDFITSADVIAHVPDQQAYMDRVAELLNPGGIFVLMTQNEFVWNRFSKLQPQHQDQLRKWPTLGEMRRMMRSKFKELHVTSIAPGGDRGILRFANSRLVAGGLRKVIGKDAQFSLYERLLIGRELVVVAQRR